MTGDWCNFSQVYRAPGDYTFILRFYSLKRGVCGSLHLPRLPYHLLSATLSRFNRVVLYSLPHGATKGAASDGIGNYAGWLAGLVRRAQ